MTRPLLLFAHGAGAGHDHPWMQRWAARLAQLGEVVPVTYPYMAAGRRAPDRLPKLLAAHLAQLARAREGHAGPVVLVGKSMGSRVGCHASLEAPVDALVCFGYPLVGSSKKRPVRDAVLKELRAPVLFLQGDRDRMGPAEAFAAVRPAMSAPSALRWVEGGNHSLEVGKRELARQGLTQQAVDDRLQEHIAAFLAAHLEDCP